MQVNVEDVFLQKLAGVQSHFLSLHLCEMAFPEMVTGDASSEFQQLGGVSITQGDTLPLVLLNSGVVGVLVVELVKNATIRGIFHYVGESLENSAGDRAAMKITSEFMGTTIEVSNLLGEVVITAEH
jgi:hypothetical protein